MEKENIFQKIIDSPLEYASEWKRKTGKPIVGYFCSYASEEIIHAAGALPIRIYANLPHTPHSDSHFQPYSCNYIRSVFDWGLSGKTDFIDGFVFTQTCDTMQRFADIWKNNNIKGFITNLVLPAKLDSDLAKNYMNDVYVKFSSQLSEKLNIKIKPETLSESITLFNNIRKVIKDIYLLRLQHPNALSNREYYTLLKASTVMDRNDFLCEALKLHKTLSEASNTSPKPMKKILLIGGPCNVPEIFQLFDDANVMIVADDLCNGTRSMECETNADNNPLDSISNRYFNRISCPTKFKSLNHRKEYLQEMASNNNVNGIVFLQEKFCEPHAFDYPYLKKTFDDMKLPSLYVELNAQDENSEALNNRLEAFFEMLQN